MAAPPKASGCYAGGGLGGNGRHSRASVDGAVGPGPGPQPVCVEATATVLVMAAASDSMRRISEVKARHGMGRFIPATRLKVLRD
jgi:hypothetical protein